MHRLHRIAAIALTLSGTIAGCASQGALAPEDADLRLRTSVVTDATWERIVRPGFSFSLPPGFQKLDHQPIDSDAAAYVRGDVSLSYDFGRYSGLGHLPESGDHVRQRIAIGGRVAVVTSYTDDAGLHVLEAWWGDVNRDALGANHLAMRAELADDDEKAELLAAIYSVQFD